MKTIQEQCEEKRQELLNLKREFRKSMSLYQKQLIAQEIEAVARDLTKLQEMTYSRHRNPIL